MHRLFELRADTRWLGGYASGEARRDGAPPPALLLLDGDDVRVERHRRRPNLPAPTRLYFFRHPNMEALQACLRSGARGCLDKQVTAEAVLRAVTAAGSGLFVMSPALLVEILRDCNGTAESDPSAADHGDRWLGLTQRQRQIVDCVAAGMSNKEIARTLHISPETVKTHLHHIFEREGVHGRIALLADVGHAARGPAHPLRERPGQAPDTSGKEA